MTLIKVTFMETVSALSIGSQVMVAGLVKSRIKWVIACLLSTDNIRNRTSCLFTHTLRFALFLGHVISTKKEELTAILDHFGIQVRFVQKLAHI